MLSSLVTRRLNNCTNFATIGQCYISKYHFHRKHSINHAFLENGIHSHRHAWFWGLFLTDGHVRLVYAKGKTARYEIMWGQRYDGYPSLDRIRSIVDSTHHLKFNGTNYEGSLEVRLSLYSKIMASAAIQLMGCAANRKTFDLTVSEVNRINPETYSSLIRGMFEGDGCWSVNHLRGYMNLSLASASAEFLQSVKDVINRCCLKTNKDIGRIISSKSWFVLYYYYFFKIRERKFNL